jgi:RNA polymerase sigma-70 factor (ECF subfamily)
VVQDAWLDVIRGAGGFRGDGPVRGWLAAIVRRRVGTTWRSRDARPQVLMEFLPEDTTAVEELENRVALRREVAGLLGRLPRDQREALWWVDGIGLPVDEVAATLGVAVGTVKSRYHRGRARLILETGG